MHRQYMYAVGLGVLGAFCAMAGLEIERLAGAVRAAPAERLGAALGDGAIDRLGVARMGAAARPRDADLSPVLRWAWASLIPKTVKRAPTIKLVVKQMPECRLVGMA